MDDEGSTGFTVALGALLIAGAIVGFILLQNLFAYKVLEKASAQPPMAFPTVDFHLSPAMLTPWAMSTPWFQSGLYDLSTPTPYRGGVIIVNR
jgi:hypothetical protein